MLAAVFAPQYLRHRVFTIPEFFEKRFGVETRVLLTFYFLAMIVLTKTSVALFSGSRVLADLNGWDFGTLLWAIGIITAIHTIVAVSLLTAPPPAGVLAGTFSFSWRAGDGDSRRHLRAVGARRRPGQVSAPTEPPLPESDLKTIADAWPGMPRAIKNAILALVDASQAFPKER